MAIGLAEARYDFFFTILDRTDLRTGVSGAKFDVEVDFEVRLPPAPPKRYKISEKLIFRSENFADFFFSTSKNETLGIV